MTGLFLLFTLAFLVAKYFKVVPNQSKFGAAADKLLGSEHQSCAQESAIGNERERRLRNSGKKDKKKRKGDDKKSNNPDEEDDTFDKV
jgi:hypothetical protein